MPRQLFDSSRPRPPRSRWTFVITPIVHVVVIASAVIATLATGELPKVREHLVGVVPVDVQPPPPAAGMVRGAVRSSAAPVNAPSTISDEPDQPRSLSVGAFRELGSADGAPLGIPGGSPVVSDLTAPPHVPAPPPPARTAPVRVGGSIRGPQRIAGGPPRYPALAQAAHVEGNVVLDAVIDEHGVVRDLRLLRSIPLLDQAALDAVRQWRYTPTLLNGVPVPVIMTVTVAFRLQ
jgi:periplasmic protein TonB